MTSSIKGHDTGLRMLEILKILLDGEADKRTIIDKVKINDDIGNANTFEAYIKYFNTFEELGLKLELTHSGAYKLKNAFFSMDVTAEEKDVLVKLIGSIYKLFNNKQETDASNVLKRLDKYINFNSEPVFERMDKLPELKTPVINIVNKLKQIMFDETEAEITYKKRSGTEETLQGSVTNISEENGRYFILFNTPSLQRNRRIYADMITSVKPLEEKTEKWESGSTVIYELYSRAAKLYRLKPWEILEDFGNGFVRIINTKEDFESLLPRLLKYGENCKIIYPDDVIKNFLKLADDILNNLEAKECRELH